MANFNGTAIALVCTGGVLAYSGIKGKHISGVVRSLIAGKSPSGNADSDLTITNISRSNESELDAIPGAGGGSTQYQHVGGAGKTQVINFLKAKKLRNASIAGIAGNIQIESSFNSAALNAAEGAIGYCQWELGRRTRLQQYAAAHGTSETDGNTQLNFMWQELNTSYIPAKIAVMTAPSASAAAAAFDSMYEVSAGTSRAQRQAAAEAIYSELT